MTETKDHIYKTMGPLDQLDYQEPEPALTIAEMLSVIEQHNPRVAAMFRAQLKNPVQPIPGFAFDGRAFDRAYESALNALEKQKVEKR
jgi:hypothetical protein